MPRLLLLLILCIPVGQAFAQRFYWGGDFSTIFDNREGDNAFTDTKTFFQTQLAPEIGISFDDSIHRVAAGAVWTQPIGTPWKEGKLDPTVYYRYNKGSMRGALGSFPRTQLHRPLPDFIWNDSCNYTCHNIRGAMIGFADSRGYFDAVIDWRGMQTATRREAFNIITSGERLYRNGLFLWGGTAMMNHFAKSADPASDEHVVDNFLCNLYIGTDLSQSLFPIFDCFTVKAGILASATRDRNDMDWLSAAGFRAEIETAWRWLEVKDSFYAGGRLFPIYQRYGSLLDQGEPFYQSKIYNRTSVAAYLLKRNHVDLRASLDFHTTSDSFIFYQRLILRVWF